MKRALLAALLTAPLLACAEPSQPGAAAQRSSSFDSDTRVSFVDVGGARINTLESGPTDGHPVVLLHGAAYRAATWDTLGTLAHLGGLGYRAIAIDLPGFGESERIDFGFAEFLELALPALGLHRAALVAPSMSGRFALPFVASHPERVRAFMPIAPAGVSTYADSLFGSKVRTLILWGGSDEIFPPAQADRLAQMFQRAEVQVLSGAGHACYLEQPEQFHELLAGFLDTAY